MFYNHKISGCKEGSLIVILVNVLGFALYVLWCRLEKIQKISWPKFCSLAFGGLFLLIVSGISLASIYVPISAVRAANYNLEMRKIINNIALLELCEYVFDSVEAIKSSEKAMGMVSEDSVSLLENGTVVYKKIDSERFLLSWNYRPLKDGVKIGRLHGVFKNDIEDFKKVKNTRECKLRKCITKPSKK
jgi:hypothetical protein